MQSLHYYIYLAISYLTFLALHLKINLKCVIFFKIIIFFYLIIFKIDKSFQFFNLFLKKNLYKNQGQVG